MSESNIYALIGRSLKTLSLRQLKMALNFASLAQYVYLARLPPGVPYGSTQLDQSTKLKLEAKEQETSAMELKELMELPIYEVREYVEKCIAHVEVSETTSSPLNTEQPVALVSDVVYGQGKAGAASEGVASNVTYMTSYAQDE